MTFDDARRCGEFLYSLIALVWLISILIIFNSLIRMFIDIHHDVHEMFILMTNITN